MALDYAPKYLQLPLLGGRTVVGDCHFNDNTLKRIPPPPFRLYKCHFGDNFPSLLQKFMIFGKICPFASPYIKQTSPPQSHLGRAASPSLMVENGVVH